jgi:hypothetical protein
MREFIVQRAWDNFHRDLGLGRIQAFIMGYNSFLFTTSIVFFGTFDLYFLIPVFVGITFFSFYRKFIRWRPHKKFLFMFVPMLLAIGFNYFLIGRLDRIAGGFHRYDEFFLNFEKTLFGSTLGMQIESFVTGLGVFGQIQFDLMMLSYFLFYLFPYVGAIRFYRNLRHNRKYVIGRFMAGLTIFHSLNYLCYLLIPVTGPQHYVPYMYQQKIPFSIFGEKLHEIIHFAQNNYIDCFPSGHLGATLLVTFWMFRIKDQIRYPMLILTILIGLATLTLRYHYLLDLVFAIPLTGLSYYLGKKLIPVAHQEPIDDIIETSTHQENVQDKAS